MNQSKTQDAPISQVGTDVDEILNIILKAGRTEAEAVFLAHIIVREVDKFFDHLSESHDVISN